MKLGKGINKKVCLCGILILLLFGCCNFVFANNLSTNSSDIKMENLTQSKLQNTKMVVLVTGCVVGTVDKVMYETYKKELEPKGYNFTLKIYTMDLINLNSTVYMKFKEDIKDANIFFLCTRPGYPVTGLTYGTELDAPIDFQNIINSLPSGAKVFVLGTTKPNVTRTDIGIELLAPPYAGIAAPMLSQENMKRLILEILRRAGVINITLNETRFVPPPSDFLYHPDAPYGTIFQDLQSYITWYKSSGKYKEGQPWVGVPILGRYYVANNMEVYKKLIGELESRGLNVIPYFYTNDAINSSRKYFMKDGKPLVDIIVACLQFGYWTDNATLKLYKDLNVPVLGPLPVFSQTTLDEYLKNKKMGLRGLEYFWLCIFEVQGRIEPILIGGDIITNIDENTGYPEKKYMPYEFGIKQLVDRVTAWINLRKKNNSDKKIAIVYFDNTHDEKMPVTNGLNLYKSLANLLNSMKLAGYDLGNVSISPTFLMEMINRCGRNPKNVTNIQYIEELIKNGCITIDVEEYLKWYNTLPKILRDQVEAVWGPPPGNVMVYKNKIVIPGFILGKIFLGPNPVWKWKGSLQNLYNNTLPPTHQFIAFYLYIRNKFHADALVCIGQHGTLELLPGRPCGMTESDWPNNLIGYLPYIHLLRMDDPLESVINPIKRRAYGITLSYLPPPLIKTELFGEFKELSELLKSWESAQSLNNTERMEVLEKLIQNKINEIPGLKDRIGANEKTPFVILKDKLYEYLKELQETLTTFGLHTLGELPDNKTLEKFIDVIVEYDPEHRNRDEVKKLLIDSCSNEINAVLKALNGEFIDPVPAKDPITNLNALPTGRNMYSFDPDAVPDKAAIVLAKKCVNEFLKRYKETYGKYPETVAIDISDLIPTQGLSLAIIFELIGLKPIYENEKLVGADIVPLEELGRPRIDVLILDLHNFRSLVPNALKVIDNAIKRIVSLNEPTSLNFLRKHYLSIKQDLLNEFISSGLAKEESERLSERLARSRLFGLPPGSDPHGVSVDRVLWSKDDWTPKELAEMYTNYYSYVYGADLDGIHSPNLLKLLTRTVETSIAIMPYRSSGEGLCLYRASALINFAVRYLTGREMESYIIKTAYAIPRVNTLKESYYDTIVTTLLNPEWLEGKLNEGPSGHASVALQIRDLFTTDVLVKVINKDMWNRLVSIYLNRDILRKFDASAAEMICRYIYQAYSRGMVQLTSQQLNLASEYLKVLVPSTIPGAPTTPQPSIPGIPTTTPQPSIPGAPSQLGAPTALGRVGIGTAATRGVSPGISGPSGRVGGEVGARGAAQAAGAAGKAYEITPVSKGIGKPGIPFAGIIGVIILIALIAVGYLLRRPE